MLLGVPGEAACSKNQNASGSCSPTSLTVFLGVCPIAALWCGHKALAPCVPVLLASNVNCVLTLSLLCHVVLCRAVLLQEAIISHGCTVKNSNISSAVVGLRSNIEEGCTIDVSHQEEDGGKLR